MSAPFPSPEYIKLCTQPEVADRLREVAIGLDSGDWVLRKEDNWVFLVVEADLESEALHLYGGPDVQMVHDETLFWGQRYIPLFQPRQLRTMLERQGRFLMFKGPCAMKEYRYHVTAMAEDLTRLDARIDSHGPDLETALLRALVEVVKEEK